MAFNGTGTIISGAGIFAEVLDINGPGLSRIAINTSHMLSANSGSSADAPYHTYIPGALVEGGELSVQIAYDPSVSIPIASGTSAFAVYWSGGSAAFSGALTAFNIRTPLEGRATADTTIKVMGKITFA